MMHSHKTMAGTALLVAAALAGCGESDLPEHHQEVLACAEIERAGGQCGTEPVPAAAAPAPNANPNAARPAGQLQPGDEPIEGIDLEDYQLVFSDEFSGDALDPTRWKTAYEWGPDLVINDEQQYYVDTMSDPDFGATPFSLGDDTLTISATRTPEALRAKANEQPWLSGVLSSAGLFDLQYGYVEARVDLPAGVGVAPAFWMLATELDGARPRVFIGEHDGGDADALSHDYQFEDEQGAVLSAGRRRIEVPGLSDGFHTIGLSWTSEELIYYVDGKARYRIIGEQLPAEQMYFVLNLAMGGGVAGTPDASTAPVQDLVVDYVRVWKRKGT